MVLSFSFPTRSCFHLKHFWPYRQNRCTKRGGYECCVAWLLSCWSCSWCGCATTESRAEKPCKGRFRGWAMTYTVMNYLLLLWLQLYHPTVQTKLNFVHTQYLAQIVAWLEGRRSIRLSSITKHTHIKMKHKKRPIPRRAKAAARFERKLVTAYVWPLFAADEGWRAAFARCCSALTPHHHQDCDKKASKAGAEWVSTI